MYNIVAISNLADISKSRKRKKIFIGNFATTLKALLDELFPTLFSIFFVIVKFETIFLLIQYTLEKHKIYIFFISFLYGTQTECYRTITILERKLYFGLSHWFSVRFGSNLSLFIFYFFWFELNLISFRFSVFVYFGSLNPG